MDAEDWDGFLVNLTVELAASMDFVTLHDFPLYVASPKEGFVWIVVTWSAVGGFSHLFPPRKKINSLFRMNFQVILYREIIKHPSNTINY